MARSLLKPHLMFCRVNFIVLWRRQLQREQIPRHRILFGGTLSRFPRVVIGRCGQEVIENGRLGEERMFAHS